MFGIQEIEVVHQNRYILQIESLLFQPVTVLSAGFSTRNSKIGISMDKIAAFIVCAPSIVNCTDICLVVEDIFETQR